MSGAQKTGIGLARGKEHDRTLSGRRKELAAFKIDAVVNVMAYATAK